jgi:hypothetical protein
MRPLGDREGQMSGDDPQARKPAVAARIPKLGRGAPKEVVSCRIPLLPGHLRSDQAAAIDLLPAKISRV